MHAAAKKLHRRPQTSATWYTVVFYAEHFPKHVPFDSVVVVVGGVLVAAE